MDQHIPDLNEGSTMSADSRSLHDPLSQVSMDNEDTRITDMSHDVSHDVVHHTSSDVPLDGGQNNLLGESSTSSLYQNGAITNRVHQSKNAFHVDKSLIKSAEMTETDAATLNHLGLDVFNQDEFEQNVMGQVDQAIASQEKARLQALVKKELAAVVDEIRMCKQEVSQLGKVLHSFPLGTSNKDIEKRKLTLKRHQENKLKQLRKLQAKHNSLSGKIPSKDGCLLTGATEDIASLEEVLGLESSSKETEMDELIRKGEMTPFGMTMKTGPSQPSTKKSSHPMTPVTTDFEKYLLDQSSKSVKIKKRKKSNATSTHSPKVPKMDIKHGSNGSDAGLKNGTVSRKGKQVVKGTIAALDSRHTSRTDNRGSTLSVGGSGHSMSCSSEDSDEYVPDQDDLKNSWLSEDDSGAESANDSILPPQKKIMKKKRIKRVKYIPEDEESPKKDRTRTTHKCKDDANEMFFKKRIKAYRKCEAERKHTLVVEEKEDFEDAVIDGGFTVPGVLWHKLYRYQQTGVGWLWELHCQQAGGIVGDEMGLGKTLQTITFLAGLRHSHLKDKGTRYTGLGPTIVVCPATVMHQWVREFHKWWPPFKVVVLHSSGCYTQSEESLVRGVVREHSILITSYGTMLGYQDIILKYNWHYIILDEGHKIRNPDAKITLACKQVKTGHRLILSGSPVQNNLKELWSLIDFVFPGKLGTLPDFMEHFSVPIVQGGYANASQVQVQTAYKCASILRDTINPYLLRRTKADVNSTLKLPSKNEQVLFCRLTDHQKDVYKEYLGSRECQAIISGKFMIFPGLITLRKISNHPDLSTGGPKAFCHEYSGSDEELKYGYFKRSGKMLVVEALLKLWKKQDHKVLLFTQTKQMLNILEKFVLGQEYNFLRMDGTTPIGSRQKLINRFNTDPSLFVFLLTTRVGGLGVNLTGANRIIIFDPDWNPSTDVQARERSWRIGQERQVTIYRLLTSGTIEEKIYHRQIFKQFLTNRVLKDPKQRRFFKSNDMYELFTLSTQDQDDDSTETAAIFAGTGSEVTVKPPLKVKSHKTKSQNSKTNRFDILKEKKDEGNEQVVQDDDTELVNPKVQGMRELAKKLSQQFSKRQHSIQTKDVLNLNEVTPNGNCNDGEVSHGQQVMGGNGDKSTSNERTSKTPVDKRKKKKNREKHKRSRKRKDAVCEGEKIAYLNQVSDFNKESQEEERQRNKQENDYVLAKLFKKSGVHSALQHDTIMQSSHPDYALVEAEAHRVAKNAAKALKKSRSHCHTAASGIPTWTGSNRKSPPLPRFGKKKVAISSQVKETRDEGISTRHFDGDQSGLTSIVTETSKDAVSSSQLILNMHARNITNDDESDAINVPLNPGDQDLISDIRTFISCQSATDGQATTAELLEQFGARLPNSDSAKFKAMLKQICDFGKQNSVGTWYLKTEFR